MGSTNKNDTRMYLLYVYRRLYVISCYVNLQLNGILVNITTARMCSSTIAKNKKINKTVFRRDSITQMVKLPCSLHHNARLSGSLLVMLYLLFDVILSALTYILARMKQYIKESYFILVIVVESLQLTF